MATTLADLASARRAVRQGSCPRCGGPTKASVNIQLRESGQGGKPIVTRAKTFCEPCAVAIWEKVTAELDANGDA